jgi:hypothetical protein
VQRAADLLPRQGDREPWINPQNYGKDKKMFRKSPVDDGVMRFTSPERMGTREPAASSTV